MNGGYENLMSPEEVNAQLTPEEMRERMAELGRKSGEAKRKRKSRRELARLVSQNPVTDPKTRATLQDKLGLDEDDLTNDALVVAAVFQGVAVGDIKAVEKWESWTEEEQKQEETVYKLPAEIIGEAFVQINRRIEPNYDYIFKGGRGGGKSSYLSEKIVELIKNNPSMHVCIVRKVGGTLRDSVYAQIKWAIDQLGLNDEFSCKVSPLEITYKKTGQIIYFRGCDDPIKLKSIKPPFGYIGILWIEERDQLNGSEEERNVKQSVLRGGAESYFFASYNPPKSKSNWVNREEKEPNPRRIVHNSNYTQADPEWLGQKFIDDAEHLKEVNPAAYEHEYMGVPNGEGGNVFEFVEIRKITDAEIQRMDNIKQGVDFGWYPDQFAFLRTYYNSKEEKIYLIDELYVNKWANSKTGQWIIDHGYNDFYVICDSAEPKSVNDYRDMGIPARGAIKGAGSIDYGFKWLQSRTLVIDPERTPGAYQEIINYEYDRDKDGNVISGYPDGNDHAISALRYAYEPLFNRRGSKA